MFTGFTIVFGLFLLVLWKAGVIIHNREVAIKERFGKFQGKLEPGLRVLIPFVDRVAYQHDTREQVMEVPPQSCITKDNIQVEIDGVVYIKVMDPVKASYNIGNYKSAAINLAQTTMRSEIGKLTLDQTFSERDNVNDNIVREIDKAAQPWGIKVKRYEVMNITPSDHVVNTMEQQMEAERQKRAEITLSEGKMEAQINISAAERTHKINLSEGDKVRRINEAEGRANAISVVAEASSEAIKMVADAIQAPGGRAAVKMQIVDEFIDSYGEILGKADVRIVPEDLARVRAFFEGVHQVGDTMSNGRAPTVIEAPPLDAPADTNGFGPA